MKYQLNLRSFFAALIGTTSVVAISSTGSAQAETFSINNRAMDTGYHVSRINGGGPRMVLWDHNVNSDNQNFDVIQGNRGGQLLRHRSTGMCLNAHRAGAGSLVNTFTCNANDLEQNFVITDHGNWYRVLRLANTSFCVDSTPSTNNGQQVIMWYCLPNGQNHFQRWLSQGARQSPTPASAWQNPLPGYAAGGYGWRPNPTVKHANEFHTGIDIATGGQQPSVRAARDGVVHRAAWDMYGYGNMVEIQHSDGTRSYYAHLSSMAVSQGRQVRAGEIIGNVGSTGRSTGNHLHFEIRVSPYQWSSDAKDPRSYVRF